jgi:hypothetical protein
MPYDLEPEAHCYLCPHGQVARPGDMCNEYKLLNPQYEGGYDRKFCHWGEQSIRQVKLENSPMIEHALAIRTQLLKLHVTYEELLLVKAHAIELRREVDNRLEMLRPK